MATSVGTFLKIDIDGKVLVGETSSSKALASTIIDTSSKASCRTTTGEYGRYAETGSFSSIGSTAPVVGFLTYEDLKALVKAGTKPTAFITEYDCDGVEVVGAYKTTGTILISNLSQDAPDNDKITFSGDYQFDGEI